MFTVGILKDFYEIDLQYFELILRFSFLLFFYENGIRWDGSNYTERKKKRRVNFIPKFHSSLKRFVKYFTMITKRYVYGTKVPNFIGL